MTRYPVVSGIDRIVAGEAQLPKQRYGLVTAAHARTQTGQTSRQALQAQIELTYLFSPEHGLEGVQAAGAKIGQEHDRLTGIPVHSLYQTQGEEELIPAEVLATFDAFLYDLPDLGVRFYTYISTCFQILEAAAEAQKPVYILDRPNPLGGTVTEGLIQAEQDYSFVGAYSVPIRYGLTIGELAQLYVSEKQLAVELHVITCTGWSREMLWPDTGQIFAVPSPNIPNWQTALLYPGTCLIEGTNLSEGRGTSRPFTWFGAPWIDQEELCAALDALEHPGLELRPQGFIPTFSKHQDAHCKGVTLEITDPDAVRSVQFMVQAISTIRRLYPDHFELIGVGSGVKFMERLMGADFVRTAWSPEGAPGGVDAGSFSRDEAQAAQGFAERVQEHLLYN